MRDICRMWFLISPNTDIYAITYTKTTNMTPLEHLRELLLEESRRKFPNVPDYARKINTFDAMSPEKREKKRIESFLNAAGHYAAIIENRGQRKDNRKVVTDVLGGQKVIGSVEYIGSGMRRGLADIKAIINGIPIDFELKREYKKGKDRMSSFQLDELERVNRAGGKYVVVSSFEDFYRWYLEFLNQQEISSR